MLDIRYNPDFDPMPIDMVSYGQPSNVTMIRQAAKRIGHTAVIEAVEELYSMFEDDGVPVFDMRFYVHEYTHPDNPMRIMHTRLMNEDEAEVFALQVAQSQGVFFIKSDQTEYYQRRVDAEHGARYYPESELPERVIKKKEEMEEKEMQLRHRQRNFRGFYTRSVPPSFPFRA